MWPLWEFEHITSDPRGKSAAEKAELADAKLHLNAVEYSAYLKAIKDSQFRAILNEKIPPLSQQVTLPPSVRISVISDDNRRIRGHADVRIARRAETIARLAAVAHERGEVTAGLRRVLVIQAIRLAYLSAARLAFTEGREPPDPQAIDTDALIGTVLADPDDPFGETDSDATI